MAYDPSVPPSLIAQGVGGPRGLRWFALMWIDPIADVLEPGYISNASEIGMRAGDGLIYKDTNRGEWDHYDLIVDSIAVDGSAVIKFPEMPEEALQESSTLDPDDGATFIPIFIGGRMVRISPALFSERLSLITGAGLTPMQFNAVGNGIANDLAAWVACEQRCFELGAPMQLGPYEYKIDGADFTTRVPIFGSGRKFSRVSSNKRILFPDDVDAVGLRGFRFFSTMESVPTFSGIIHGENIGDECFVDDMEIEHSTVTGGAYQAVNGRRTFALKGGDGFSVHRSKIIGGGLWLNSLMTNFDISGNDLDMINQGEDAIKVTGQSNSGVISNNHIRNTNRDGIDLFTAGKNIVVSGNTFENIGFMGIQCKTILRDSPYTSGSSDQPSAGSNDNVVITDNILNNITMVNVAAGEAAAAISCHTADERFSMISGAANNGSGLIRITATAHIFTTGQKVKIRDIEGTVEANGIWTVTVINANTFDLQGSAFVNAYSATGKGSATRARDITGAVAGTGGVVRLTLAAHGRTSGNIMQVENVGGTTEANGTFPVTVVDANTLELQGTTFANAYTSGGSASLALVAANGPGNYSISGNIIKGVNTAGVNAVTAGIRVDGVNVALGHNVVTDCRKGASSVSFAGSALMFGRLVGDNNPALPTNITAVGGVYQGENAGIAINGFIDGLSLTGVHAGYDAKEDELSLYGVRVATGSRVVGLNIVGGQYKGSSRSFLAETAALVYFEDASMVGAFFDGLIDCTSQFDGFIFSGNKVEGSATFGATLLQSTAFTAIGNHSAEASSAAAAITLNKCKGATIKDNIVKAGRDLVAVRFDCTQYDIRDNKGSGITDVPITAAANNGAGLIRITTGVVHNWNTGDWVTIDGVAGTIEANGTWQIIRFANNRFDLVGSAFANAYVSGGNAYRAVAQSDNMASIATAQVSGNRVYA